MLTLISVVCVLGIMFWYLKHMFFQTNPNTYRMKALNSCVELYTSGWECIRSGSVDGGENNEPFVKLQLLLTFLFQITSLSIDSENLVHEKCYSDESFLKYIETRFEFVHLLLGSILKQGQFINDANRLSDINRYILELISQNEWQSLLHNSFLPMHLENSEEHQTENSIVSARKLVEQTLGQNNISQFHNTSSMLIEKSSSWIEQADRILEDLLCSKQNRYSVEGVLSSVCDIDIAVTLLKQEKFKLVEQHRSLGESLESIDNCITKLLTLAETVDLLDFSLNVLQHEFKPILPELSQSFSKYKKKVTQTKQDMKEMCDSLYFTLQEQNYKLNQLLQTHDLINNQIIYDESTEHQHTLEDIMYRFDLWRKQSNVQGEAVERAIICRGRTGQYISIDTATKSIQKLKNKLDQIASKCHLQKFIRNSGYAPYKRLSKPMNEVEPLQIWWNSGFSCALADQQGKNALMKLVPASLIFIEEPIDYSRFYYDADSSMLVE
jgi:hypothetical protein